MVLSIKESIVTNRSLENNCWQINQVRPYLIYFSTKHHSLFVVHFQFTCSLNVLIPETVITSVEALLFLSKEDSGCTMVEALFFGDTSIVQRRSIVPFKV